MSKEVTTTNTQQSANAIVPSERVRSLLLSPTVKSRFDEVLGKRAPAFMSSIISAVNANKQLQECTPQSIIGSAAIAAAMDLPITPGLGMAHMVPFNDKNLGKVAQFQLGWKGFVQLALRTGQYKTLNATPILEGQIVKHNPFTGDMELKIDSTSSKIVGYLLYFRLINGFEKYHYMTKEQCEKHAKRYSQTFKRGYGVWVDDFDSMALKTVVKMGLGKYGVLSVEMQRAFESDQAVVNEVGEVVSYSDNNQRDVSPEAAPQVKALNEKIKSTKNEAAPKQETEKVAVQQQPEEQQEEHL